MLQTRATFNKDPEDIVQKYSQLLEKIKTIPEREDDGIYGPEAVAIYYEVRVSALNLIARTAGHDSIYYRELLAMSEPGKIYVPVLTAVLTAAMTDFREGFMADTKLLVSAEVLADFLVQAEVLLDHGYKDAAAVIVRAVLEDGLRRVCLSKGLAVKDRAGSGRTRSGAREAEHDHCCPEERN